MSLLPDRYPTTTEWVVKIVDVTSKRDFADHFGEALGVTVGCLFIMAFLIAIASLAYLTNGAALVFLAVFFGPALIYSAIKTWRDRR